MASDSRQVRVVSATHGRREIRPDPDYEVRLSDWLKSSYQPEALAQQYARFATGDGMLDVRMGASAIQCCYAAVESRRRCPIGLRTLQRTPSAPASSWY